MKIKINELENYEIKIPDEDISSQRFFEILSRLNSIGKILGKSVGDEILSQPKATMLKSATKTHKVKGLTKFMRNDRALMVECYRNYYKLKEKAFVDWFYQKTGFSLRNKNAFSNKSMTKLRKELKIIPQEVGLEKFPERREKVLKFLGSEDE